jgi:hypothetical protein
VYTCFIAKIVVDIVLEMLCADWYNCISLNKKHNKSIIIKEVRRLINSKL